MTCTGRFPASGAASNEDTGALGAAAGTDLTSFGAFSPFVPFFACEPFSDAGLTSAFRRPSALAGFFADFFSPAGAAFLATALAGFFELGSFLAGLAGFDATFFVFFGIPAGSEYNPRHSEDAEALERRGKRPRNIREAFLQSKDLFVQFPDLLQREIRCPLPGH